METLAVVSLISVLATVEVLVLGFLVGRGRVTYGVPAPAMAGHPTWERLNRAHQNSLEQLVLFLPRQTGQLDMLVAELDLQRPASVAPPGDSFFVG